MILHELKFDSTTKMQRKKFIEDLQKEIETAPINNCMIVLCLRWLVHDDYRLSKSDYELGTKRKKNQLEESHENDDRIG